MQIVWKMQKLKLHPCKEEMSYLLLNHISPVSQLWILILYLGEQAGLAFIAIDLETLNTPAVHRLFYSTIFNQFPYSN